MARISSGLLPLAALCCPLLGSTSSENRGRLARIQAGQIVEDKIRGFEADLRKLKGHLKPMAEIAPQLSKAASLVDETNSGLTLPFRQSWK
jgi:hypothetical protein